VQPTSPHDISITLSDGFVATFQIDPNLGPGSGECSIIFPALFGSLQFTSTGSPASLIALDNASFMVSGGPIGPVELLDINTFDVIDPLFLQFTAEGTTFTIPNWRTFASSPASVPEPPSLALFGLGLVGVAALRCRKKAAGLSSL
jgi:PEP-CTERM motif